MTRRTRKDPSSILRDGRAIDLAFERAGYDVVRRHRQLGVPLVIWQDGRVVEVPPKPFGSPATTGLLSQIEHDAPGRGRPSPVAQTVAAFLLLAATQAAQSPSRLELAVLEETNLARTHPAAYADHLEPMLSWFQGDVMFRPGSDVGVRTNEGPAAVREAIRFLRRQPPVSPLAWSPGLWRAARDHARDLGATASTGHTGSDGSTMQQRINRYGRWREVAAENIDFGANDPRQVVISLIVDDGVDGRGHRTNIFNPSLRVAGVGCGAHPSYRHTCVIDYAGGYDEAERSRSRR